MQDNIVRFPALYTEPVHLSMMFSDDARVVIVSGNGLSIEPESDFGFPEPRFSMARSTAPETRRNHRAGLPFRRPWKNRMSHSIKERTIGEHVYTK
jgi:hypothetical protein